MYEYKFVKLKRPFWGQKKETTEARDEIINSHTKDGWRLIQIFNPKMAVGRAENYYELIFERER